MFSHPVFIWVSRRHLRLLVAQLRPAWLSGRESRYTPVAGVCCIEGWQDRDMLDL
jgi:hypothetical protein